MAKKRYGLLCALALLSGSLSLSGANTNDWEDLSFSSDDFIKSFPEFPSYSELLQEAKEEQLKRKARMLRRSRFPTYKHPIKHLNILALLADTQSHLKQAAAKANSLASSLHRSSEAVKFLNIIEFFPEEELITSQQLPQNLAPETPPFTSIEAEPSPIDTPALAEPPTPKPPAPTSSPEVKTYYIDAFQVEVQGSHPELPSKEEISHIPFFLSLQKNVWQAGLEPGTEKVSFTLSELQRLASPEPFTVGALQAIADQLSTYLKKQGYLGIYVSFQPLEQGSHTYIIQVSLTEVKRVSYNGDQKVGERIVALSPIQGSGQDRMHGDLLRKEKLERFLRQMNRHPNRQVGVELSLEELSEGVRLDYIIDQRRPWFVYAATSNSGVSSLGRYVVDLGFADTQVSNHDDVLQINLSSNTRGKVYSALGSYELPLSYEYLFNIGLNAAYSHYTSSQLGFKKKEFEGDQASSQLKLSKGMFENEWGLLELVCDLSYRYVQVKDHLLDTQSSQHFFYPGVGIHVQGNQPSKWGSFDLMLRANLKGYEEEKLALLGRSNPSERWGVLYWHGFLNWLPSLQFSAQESEGVAVRKALHELAFKSSGQISLGSRLIPQFKAVMGGEHTFRGYPTSVTSGDIAGVLSMEYILHLTPLFFKQAFNQPTFTPPAVYSDLKLFMDVGGVKNLKAKETELDASALADIGLGFSIRALNHIFFDLSWGVALKELAQANVKVGHQEVFFNVTYRY